MSKQGHIFVTEKFDTFFNRTRSALKELTGSPITKDSKIIDFIKDQMGWAHRSILANHRSATRDFRIKKDIFTLVVQEFDGDSLIGTSVEVAFSREDFEEKAKSVFVSILSTYTDYLFDDAPNVKHLSRLIGDNDSAWEEFTENDDAIEALEWISEQFHSSDLFDILEVLTSRRFKVSPADTTEDISFSSSELFDMGRGHAHTFDESENESRAAALVYASVRAMQSTAINLSEEMPGDSDEDRIDELFAGLQSTHADGCQPLTMEEADAFLENGLNL